VFVLAALALMRRQELDGFIEGLFGQEDVVDLPERAHRGLDILGELHALFAAVLAIAIHETKAATDKSMETTPRHMREMTKNAEHAMHAIVLSCKRARKQMLAALPLVAKRMVKNQQMRWSLSGAHLMLQVRVAMVNGNLRQRLREKPDLPAPPLHPIFQPTPPLLRAA